MINNLSKRTKTIIGIVVGIVVLWAIYYFAFAQPKKVADAAKAAADAAAKGAAAAAAAVTAAAADAANGNGTVVTTSGNGVAVN